MKRDLQIAREIQTWLLPGHRRKSQVSRLPTPRSQRTPSPATTTTSSASGQNTRTGSRDFRRRDVAGKSIPAAMLMATFQASLKTLSTTPASLPELAAGLNQYACSNSQGGLRFTTVFWLSTTLLAASSLHQRRSQSTHSAPQWRLNRAPRCRRPSAGHQADAKYESASVALAPGDWLVISRTDWSKP